MGQCLSVAVGSGGRDTHAAALRRCVSGCCMTLPLALRVGATLRSSEDSDFADVGRLVPPMELMTAEPRRFAASERGDDRVCDGRAPAIDSRRGPTFPTLEMVPRRGAAVISTDPELSESVDARCARMSFS